MSEAPSPRFVLEDLPAPLAAGIMAFAGLIWLAIRAGPGLLEGTLGILDLVAAGMVVAIGAVFLAGPRRIELHDDEIRVYRRGRLARRQPVSALVAIEGLLLVARLRFADGESLLWFPTFDWSAATDFLAAKLRERPGWSARDTGDPRELSALPGELNFPPSCTGCGGAAPIQRGIVARRGLHLGFISAFVERSVLVPACRACVRRRQLLGGLALLGPLVVGVGALFLPFYWPGHPDVIGAIVGAAALAFVLGRNRGEEWSDAAALGLRGKLHPDGATVTLRLRDPALAAEVRRRSAARRASPRAVEPARVVG